MYVSVLRYCAWVHSSTILSRFWPTFTWTAKRLAGWWMIIGCFVLRNLFDAGTLHLSLFNTKKTTGQLANDLRLDNSVSSGWPKAVSSFWYWKRGGPENVPYLTCSKKRGVIQGSRTSQPPRFTPRTTSSPQPIVSLLQTLILYIVLKGAFSLCVFQVQMLNQSVMFCKIVWLRPESSGQLGDNCRFWRAGEYLVGSSLKSLQLLLPVNCDPW